MRKLLSFLLAIVIMFSLPLSSFAILPSQVTNPMITFGDDVIEVRSANVGIWTNEERAFLAEFISNENTFIDVYSSYICLRIFHDSSASYRLNSDGTSCSISKVDGSRLNYTSMFITANGDASGLYLDDISRSFSISPILTPILSANFFDKNGLTLPNTHFVQYDHSGVMFYYTAGFKPDFKPNFSYTPEPEPEPEPEPIPPSPPPVIDIPTIPTIDNPYVPYDTSLWNAFLEKILGDINVLVTLGFSLFAIILSFYLIVWIVKKFVK